MPGSNAGTGWPISFHCSRCRRTVKGCATWSGRSINHCDHKQVRTGRTRPYTGGNKGIRGLMTHHEYRCECGHVGWSRHADVTRLPTETP